MSKKENRKNSVRREIRSFRRLRLGATITIILSACVCLGTPCVHAIEQPPEQGFDINANKPMCIFEAALDISDEDGNPVKDAIVWFSWAKGGFPRKQDVRQNRVKERKEHQKIEKFLEFYRNSLSAKEIEKIAKILSLPKRTCIAWGEQFRMVRVDPVRFRFTPWEAQINWNRDCRSYTPGSVGEWGYYNKLAPANRVFRYERLQGFKRFRSNYKCWYNIGPLDDYETAEKRVQTGKNIIENNVISYMFKITKKGYEPYYLGPYTEHVSGGDKWSSYGYHYKTYWGYYQATLRTKGSIERRGRSTEDTNFCPECSQRVGRDDQFCRGCGKKLGEQSAQETSKKSTRTSANYPHKVRPIPDRMNVPIIEISLALITERYSGEVTVSSPSGKSYVSMFNQDECVVCTPADVLAIYKNGDVPIGDARGNTVHQTNMFLLENFREKGNWTMHVILRCKGEEYRYKFTRLIGEERHPHGWYKMIYPGSTESD